METGEEVMEELLDLVEASSKNPIEEFFTDFIEISSKDTVEEILADVRFKDEMELLEDTAETSSEDRPEENLTSTSIEHTINHLLAFLIKTPSKAITDQLLKDFIQVTVNDPIEEILKEIPSSKNSTSTTRESNERISGEFDAKELSKKVITESSIDSESSRVNQSHPLLSYESGFTANSIFSKLRFATGNI